MEQIYVALGETACPTIGQEVLAQSYSQYRKTIRTKEEIAR
jgi:hypothetical protein